MMYNALKTVSALSFEIYKFTPVLSPFKGCSKSIFNMSVSDTITNYYIIVVRYAHKGEFYGF